MTSSKPYQYTKGWVEFYKLRFKVTPDVLIPRPETELLVDEVIRFLTDHPERAERVEGSLFTILDVGTGSGNIAISIAKNLSVHPGGGHSNFKVIATDISVKALKIAEKNAKFHKVEKRIIFLQRDLLSNIKNSPDIIVTNLPYIPSARIPYLDSSVKDFEPIIALDGGSDGFVLYRKLFQQIRLHLKGVKLIVCEIDYTHGELAVNEALKYFPDAEVEVKTDLAHKQRLLVIKFTK